MNSMTRKKIRTLKRVVAGLSIAASGMTGFWIGIGTGINVMIETDSNNAVREAYNNGAEVIWKAAESTGERGTEIYTIEIWTDGMAKVTTNQRYINQLSDNTLLITDKSYDEVIKEMRVAEDLQEVDE